MARMVNRCGYNPMVHPKIGDALMVLAPIELITAARKRGSGQLFDPVAGEDLWNVRQGIKILPRDAQIFRKQVNRIVTENDWVVFDAPKVDSRWSCCWQPWQPFFLAGNI
jgi:hypothetical protein